MTFAQTKLLLDAHVHFYDCFNLQLSLESALNNLQLSALNIEGKTPAEDHTNAFCLLCVDLQNKCWEEELERFGAVPGYSINSCAPEKEKSCTVTRKTDGASLQIVWGNQIIAAEKIEVLAFGQKVDIPDGTPLRDVMQIVREHSAFCILPWGFGKWTGFRGRLVREILNQHETTSGGSAPLYVGDNGGRLYLGEQPELLTFAESKGIWNLPGSDALPFPWQFDRVGSRGLVLTGSYDSSRPLLSIAKLLRIIAQTPQQFGSGESMFNFLRAQVGMQIKKHLRN